jgi:hypothetical protein
MYTDCRFRSFFVRYLQFQLYLNCKSPGIFPAFLLKRCNEKNASLFRMFALLFLSAFLSSYQRQQTHQAPQYAGTEDASQTRLSLNTGNFQTLYH